MLTESYCGQESVGPGSIPTQTPTAVTALGLGIQNLGTLIKVTRVGFLDQLEVLAGAEVFVLAHWVTDRDLPRRFDVPFLVARMPEGQTPVADEAEQFEPCWVRPADALARHAAETFFMIFPTLRTLERLQRYASVEAVLTACAHDKPLWISCPRAGLLGGLGTTGTAEGFVTGFRDVAFSAMLIGFARAIFVVLEQGSIVDTIVHGLAAPLAHLPVTFAALGMMAVQTALHVPVPSGSGQATLTMPLFMTFGTADKVASMPTGKRFYESAGSRDKT